jgi:hypothetical protein
MALLSHASLSIDLETDPHIDLKISTPMWFSGILYESAEITIFRCHRVTPVVHNAMRFVHKSALLVFILSPLESPNKNLRCQQQRFKIDFATV